MSKLGSDFLKEYDNYEPPFLFGRTKRELILTGGTGLGVVLGGVLYWFKFPDLFVLMVVGLIAAPSFIFGTKKEEDIKERLRFRLTKQERAYLVSEQKGKVYDFTQNQSVSEADESTTSETGKATKGV